MKIHILTQDQENKTVECLFHIPVPAGTNAAGVSWKTACLEYLAPSPVIPNNTTENTQISAGDVLELRETVRFSSRGLSDGQRLAQIRAAYDTRSAQITADLATRLNFWGLATD